MPFKNLKNLLMTALLPFIFLSCGQSEQKPLPDLQSHKSERSRQACAELNLLKDMSLNGRFAELFLLCASNQSKSGEGETLSASIDLVDQLGGAAGLDKILSLAKTSDASSQEPYPYLLAFMTFIDRASHDKEDQQLDLSLRDHQNSVNQFLRRLDIYDLGRIFLNNPRNLPEFLENLNTLQISFPDGSLQAALRQGILNQDLASALDNLAKQFLNDKDFFNLSTALLKSEKTASLNSIEQTDCLVAGRQEQNAVFGFSSCPHNGKTSQAQDAADRAEALKSSLSDQDIAELGAGLQTIMDYVQSLPEQDRQSIMNRWVGILGSLPKTNSKLLYDLLAFLDQGIKLKAKDFEHLITMIELVLMDPTQLSIIHTKNATTRLNDLAEQLLINGGHLAVCQNLELPALISSADTDLMTAQNNLLQYLKANSNCPESLPPLAAFFLDQLGCLEDGQIQCIENGLQIPALYADGLSLEKHIQASASSADNDRAIAAFTRTLINEIAKKLEENPRYLLSLSLLDRELDAQTWLDLTKSLWDKQKLNARDLASFELSLYRHEHYAFGDGWLTRLIQMKTQDLATIASHYSNLWNGPVATSQTMNTTLNGMSPAGPLTELVRLSLTQEQNLDQFSNKAYARDIFQQSIHALALFGPKLSDGTLYSESTLWGSFNSRRPTTVGVTADEVEDAGDLLIKPLDKILEIPKLDKLEDIFLASSNERGPIPSRLLGKDLNDEQADKFEKEISTFVQEYFKNAQAFSSVLPQLDSENHDLKNYGQFLERQSLSPRDKRRFALFQSLYSLSSPSLTPDLVDPQVKISGEKKIGTLPTFYRLGTSHFIKSSHIWKSYQELFDLFDRQDFSTKITVQGYLDQILPIDQNWVADFTAMPAVMTRRTKNPEALGFEFNGELQENMAPLLAFNLTTAVEFKDGSLDKWIIMPLAWQKAGTLATTPCFEGNPDSAGNPIPTDCPVLFTKQDPSVEDLKQYYQDQVRFLFCSFDAQMLDQMNLTFDEKTLSYCATHQDKNQNVIMGRRVLSDVFEVGQEPMLSPVIANLSWSLTLEKARQERWDQQTLTRRLLGSFGGNLSEMSRQSRYLDGHMAAFQRQESPLVDNYFNILKSYIPTDNNKINQYSQPEVVIEFLNQVVSIYHDAVSQDQSALHLVDRVLDYAISTPENRKLMASLNGRLQDHSSRVVLKGVFYKLIGGHLESASMGGVGFSWHLADMRLLKWFFDSQLMLPTSNLLRDFSQSEIVKSLELLSFSTKSIKQRTMVADAIIKVFLDWNLSGQKTETAISTLNLMKLQSWLNAGANLLELRKTGSSSDFNFLLQTLYRPAISFDEQLAPGLFSDIPRVSHLVLRHLPKILKSFDAILPEADGAMTVRRIMLGTSNLLNDTNETTRQSLVHLLGDERIGIRNGLLSRLLSVETRRNDLSQSLVILSQAEQKTALGATEELDRMLMSARGLIQYLQPRLQWRNESESQSTVWRYGFGILGRLTDEPELYLYPQTNLLRQWLTAPVEEVQELH